MEPDGFGDIGCKEAGSLVFAGVASAQSKTELVLYTALEADQIKAYEVAPWPGLQ